MGEIKDSGDRRSFDTGAVRDMAEGKGRCDLLPLEIIGDLLHGGEGRILDLIADFMKDQETHSLYAVLDEFAELEYDNSPQTMLLEVAKHFEEGNNKYPPTEDGTPNWQLGIPPSCYIDSAVRHFLKWSRGDEDEPHSRAFVWNILCCIWEVDYHDYDN